MLGAQPELAAAARIVFDRTPLDYLAYNGHDRGGPLRRGRRCSAPAGFASLDLLVITLITPETEQVMPAAEMPGLRSQMNDALLELVHDDPLNAWEDIPVLELDEPLDPPERGPRRAGPIPPTRPPELNALTITPAGLHPLHGMSQDSVVVLTGLRPSPSRRARS